MNRIKNSAKRAAVIVVNFNGMKYLPDLLASLQHTTYPRHLWKLILVDNASSDQSLQYARKYCGDCEIISNAENLGFTRANNQGMRKAIDAGFDYSVLLNYDTVVEPSWLEELIRAAEDLHSAAAVQSKILLFDEKDQINTIGNRIHYLGFGFCGAYKAKDGSQFSRPCEIPYASGAAVLLRNTALKKVGLFDDELFLYHEDLDLGWRMRMLGYSIINAPLSRVYHKYAFSRTAKKMYFLERNRIMVILKNYSVRTLFLLSPALLGIEIAILFYALVHGWLFQKIRGYVSLLKNLGHIYKERKKVQHRRTVPDRDICSQFTSIISFEDVDSVFLTVIANPLFRLYWRIIYPFV